jgi:hypothetical protein
VVLPDDLVCPACYCFCDLEVRVHCLIKVDCLL